MPNQQPIFRLRNDAGDIYFYDFNKEINRQDEFTLEQIRRVVERNNLRVDGQEEPQQRFRRTGERWRPRYKEYQARFFLSGREVGTGDRVRARVLIKLRVNIRYQYPLRDNRALAIKSKNFKFQLVKKEFV